MVTIQRCEWCGREFKRDGTNAVYCSNKCYELAKNEVAKRAQIDEKYRAWYRKKYQNAEHEKKLNRGINYGKLQMQDTIEKFGRVNVEIK